MVPTPQEVKDALYARLLGHLAHPDPVYQALLQEYPSRGGKMLRGLLVVYAGLAHGAPLEASLWAGTALELFQNWVLIHDDIEDGSEERRGKPALHRLYPPSLALNAGDALHGEMWGLLAKGLEAGLLTPGVLAEFHKVVRRTAYGQHLDLSWTLSGRLDLAPEDYFLMVAHKAAYYTAVAPLRLGALLSGKTPPAAYEEAGLKLGIAFQIVDDVLNLEGDEAYGKELAGDLYEGKRTLILIRYLQEAPKEARARAEALLRLPREAKPEAEVRWLWQNLLASGAVAWAKEEARRLAQEGMEALAPHLDRLPGQSAASRLRDLLTALVERRA
ncbi:polyprenyl synthetase family protein [Thermus amyloliquefaciens]|uniref:polyprenyl synthetase family protein n=1 Tax=Thermus amyloliquefaciens TaxID=1449080 RepID=UPI00056E5294|nr:polyprenyl synthetase family protein [Thermus amyloliquefaciens]